MDGNGFMCNFCSKHFSSIEDIKVHISSDHSLGGSDDNEEIKQDIVEENENHRNETNESNFHCNKCDQSFPKIELILEHQEKHHQNPPKDTSSKPSKSKSVPLSCQICGVWFRQESDLQMHHTFKHPKEKFQGGVYYDNSQNVEKKNDQNLTRQKCPGCKKDFKTIVHARLHVDTGRCKVISSEKHCKICDKTFSTSEMLYQHVNEMHSNSKKPRYCLNCGKSFENSSFLYHHQKEGNCSKVPQKAIKIQIAVGTENVPIILNLCQVCNKTFESETKLSAHEIFECVQNPKYEKSKENTANQFEDYFDALAKLSAQKLTSQSNYPCCFCNAKFGSTATLKAHITQIHPNQRTVDCQNCKQKFLTIPGFEKHICVQGDFANNEMKYEIVTYSTEKLCQVCNKNFESETLLSAHEIFECVQNPKYENSKENSANQYQNYINALEKLSAQKLSSQSNYPCCFCNAKFGSTEKLKAHVAKIHPNLQNLFCFSCKMLFNSNEQMMIHLKTVHPLNGGWYEKPRTKMLTLSMKESQTLLKHPNTYGKNLNDTLKKSEAPCSYCGKTFSDTKRVSYHEQFACQKSPYYDQTTNFKCDYCAIMFKSKNILWQHVRNEHSDKIFPCQFCPRNFKRKDKLVGHQKTDHLKELLEGAQMEFDVQIVE